MVLIKIEVFFSKYSIASTY